MQFLFKRRMTFRPSEQTRPGDMNLLARRPPPRLRRFLTFRSFAFSILIDDAIIGDELFALSSAAMVNILSAHTLRGRDSEISHFSLPFSQCLIR